LYFEYIDSKITIPQHFKYAQKVVFFYSILCE